MSVLHRFGVKLLRSALIWCQIATFCIDYVSNCYVLHRFWAKLLRSALILGQIAASCIDSGLNCCALHRFWAKLLRSALIWGFFEGGTRAAPQKGDARRTAAPRRLGAPLGASSSPRRRRTCDVAGARMLEEGALDAPEALPKRVEAEPPHPQFRKAL